MACLGTLCLVLVSPAALAEASRNILVIYSYGRLLPASLEADRVFREVLASRPDLTVAVSAEYLDNLRFTGEGYERTFVTYLRDKYALQPPEVLVVGADEAFDFVLRNRANLFPGVPIIHMSVLQENLQSKATLPADVIGTPLVYDVVGTVAQAVRWRPNSRRLVVVTGANAWDRAWEARVRSLVPRMPPQLEIEFLSGLPTAAVQRRLRELPPDSIVFTPGYHRDGAGREFSPREAAQLVAAAAPVPVYGTFSSFVGTGVVGGRMADYEDMGREGAKMVIALLDGADPATIAHASVTPTPLQLDWRQLQRWGIPDEAVPAGAIVRFREPSLWEAYRELVVVGIAVIAVQTALILALLFERRRRRRTVAELARSEQLLRLAGQAADLSAWQLDARAMNGGGAEPVARKPAGVQGPLADFSVTLARIAPSDRPAVDAALRKALATSGEFEVEYRVQDASGGVAWQAARGRADLADAPRLLGVATDITQRKLADAQAEEDRAALFHMTRVSLLGQLSASIAHQLNQPLASILANAEAAKTMLEREPLDVEELRAICADIASEDQRAAQVIRRLGVLFKRGDAVLEPLDPSELCQDTIEFTRSILQTRHVTFATQLEAGLPLISGDRVQLQQLLLNLIVNAADAMADLPEERRHVTISTSLQERHVKICVTDRGPGVPADARDKVFEPFWSTRPGGMGMGLAVCRSIVEAHQGRLTVADAAGGGAVFCALLPTRAST